MTLHTLRIGDGPRRTALLHGMLGSGRNLAGLARAWLARDPSRSFLLPDLTGHGSSAPLPPGATLHTLARDVAETLGGEPHDFLGHSLGGRVALALVEERPELVRSLVLLDIGPGPIAEAWSESAPVLQALVDAPATAPDRDTMRRHLVSRGLSGALVEWVLTNLKPGGEGYVWRIDARALSDAAKRVNDVEFWRVVESRVVPMRCIRGGASPYVTDADAARMTAAGCPVTTIEGAGHFVHVDALAKLVELLAP